MIMSRIKAQIVMIGELADHAEVDGAGRPDRSVAQRLLADPLDLLAQLGREHRGDAAGELRSPPGLVSTGRAMRTGLAGASGSWKGASRKGRDGALGRRRSAGGQRGRSYRQRAT